MDRRRLAGRLPRRRRAFSGAGAKAGFCGEFVNEGVEFMVGLGLQRSGADLAAISSPMRATAL